MQTPGPRAAAQRVVRIASALRRHRLAVVVPTYLALYAACYFAAWMLRFEFVLAPRQWELFALTLPWVLLAHVVACLATREWWRTYRYTSLGDAVHVGVAAALTATMLEGLNLTPLFPRRIPSSIVLIDAAFGILATCVMRVSIRILTERFVQAYGSSRPQPTIILGDGADAIAILRGIQSAGREFRIVGFVSDDPVAGSRIIAGQRVFALRRGLKRIVRRVGAKHLLVPGSLAGRKLQDLVHQCAELGVKAHVIPAVEQLIDGRFRLTIRDVTISDLLRREPAQLDFEAIRGYVAGKRVLVTGGAGSIGSELCRQILALCPQRLVVVDQSEFGVFTIQQELEQNAPPGTDRHYVVADIIDQPAMQRTFEEHRPQIVFHAAAYKHVPLLEDQPQVAIQNNVFGTKSVVDLSDRFGVERFVMVSTDKAVRPTSVMGSTKLVAEKYVQSASRRSRTRFLTVRFGNVLNSAGSVVPTFRRQIESGGPVTVTHPEIERFFMTIPEAVQLVLQAGAVGRSGDVMILEMGAPVRIVDLARDMIHLSGLRCPEDIEIAFTGLRPGEKLYEELFYESLDEVEKVHEKIFAASPEAPTADEIRRDLARLESSLTEGRETAAAALRHIASRYAGVETQQFEDSSPATIPFPRMKVRAA